MSETRSWIPFGLITRPHGVGGELRLMPHEKGAALPKKLATLGLHLPSGIVPMRVRGGRPGSGGAILLRLEEVKDRNAAEALAGVQASVPLDELPALGEGEFYLHELIGADGVDEQGAPLGAITRVDNIAGRDMLVLHTPQGARMIPVIDDTVAAFHRAERRVTLRVVPGLLD